MDAIFIITGLFFMIIGFIVKQFRLYNLIAGYNTMPAQEKIKYDIEKFATLFQNVFLIMGLIIIIGSVINILLKTQFISLIIILLTVIVGTTYLVIQGQKPKKYLKSKNI